MSADNPAPASTPTAPPTIMPVAEVPPDAAIP